MHCFNDSGTVHAATSKYTPEETQKIGNLVADDEWMGLSMEIVELIRMAILEDLKSKGRDFLGKGGVLLWKHVIVTQMHLETNISSDRSLSVCEFSFFPASILPGKVIFLSLDIAHITTCAFVYAFSCVVIRTHLASMNFLTHLRPPPCKPSTNTLDDYKVGDVSKEIDGRIKDEVAKMRGKDEYEVFDAGECSICAYFLFLCSMCTCYLPYAVCVHSISLCVYNLSPSLRLPANPTYILTCVATS